MTFSRIILSDFNLARTMYSSTNQLNATKFEIMAIDHFDITVNISQRVSATHSSYQGHFTPTYLLVWLNNVLYELP